MLATGELDNDLGREYLARRDPDARPDGSAPARTPLGHIAALADTPLAA
jgi:hypothetical protein